MWLDLKGPILADTVYHEGKLVAKDVVIGLPAVTFVTSDYRATGTVTLPMMGQIEAMECTITKVGLDLGLQALMALESKTLEFRWVQESKNADGNGVAEGCKAFLRVISKGIPSLSIEPGSNVEGEIASSVTRYQLFVNGQEYWLIDQLNQIIRIGGKDYGKEITSLL